MKHKHYFLCFVKYCTSEYCYLILIRTLFFLRRLNYYCFKFLFLFWYFFSEKKYLVSMLVEMLSVKYISSLHLLFLVSLSLFPFFCSSLHCLHRYLFSDLNSPHTLTYTIACEISMIQVL